MDSQESAKGLFFSMIPVPETLTDGTDNHRLFVALRSGQPKSHHELYGLHMIVHSRASDLRLKHGCLIDTWRDGKTTWYQLRAVREGEVATDGLAVDSALPHGPPIDISGPPEPSSPQTPESEVDGLCAGPGLSPYTPPGPAQLTVWEAA